MSYIDIDYDEMSLAQRISKLPKQQRETLLGKLSPQQIQELPYDWKFWARRKQRIPIDEFLNDNHRFCLALTGRGFGKTRMGAEWVRYVMENGIYTRGGIVAPTVADARDVMVDAILQVCPIVEVGNTKYPLYEPSKRKITWANGGRVLIYSADEPKRLRGANNEFIWGDELAAWEKAEEAFNMLNLGLRVGAKNKALFTTTPLPLKLIYDLIEDKEKRKRTLLIEGSTFENTNLNSEFFEDILSAYEGTALYEQEVLGQVLKNLGGLFKPEYISRYTEDEMPPMNRIVVAVDPAVTSNKSSDDTGIAVCGQGIDHNYYLLHIEGEKRSPKEWADRVVKLFQEYKADKIIAERNNGGEMVKETITQGHKDMPVELVHASRGKIVRAEPISLLYQKGKIWHRKYNTRRPSSEDKRNMEQLQKAEKQMFTFRNNPNEANDLVDAIVWGFTELSGNELIIPQPIKVAGQRKQLTGLRLL